MRAAVLEAYGQPLRIYDDVEIEPPAAGEVRVRVHHCGVCHSDLSVVDGLLPAPVPSILGHEAAGVVEEVGAGVRVVAPGDPVVLTACPPCGSCYWCQRGEFSICVNSSGLMTSTLPDGGTRLSRQGGLLYRGLGVGAFGELVTVQEAAAVRIPEGVPLDVACVIGCAVQTGVGAVINTAKVEPGATVLVTGLGGVGLSIVQGAVLAGAGRIVVSDPVAARREAARRFGATDELDPAQTDVVAAALELTGGIGADYAFEAAGKVALLETCLQATRAGGTTVIVGVPPIDEPLTISPVALFQTTEKKLVGSLLGSVHAARDIPRLVALWQAGRLDLDGLVTSRRPLAEVNEAVDDLRQARGIRTVLSL
ncbi:Zn-dependent alcohol dehydrogenase [Rhabdothermincola sediminis]|uniref:Zn-dependent alcohol dehydrogenase n=1 Tax=Rhabdothermincola sediminis TaxID=2751370 RepID=UPI001AA06688|nr:Zn-dependent alcohol dehydrogenase [Rhabdothermincola sediminis]